MVLIQMVSFVILCVLFFALKNVILRRDPQLPRPAKGVHDTHKVVCSGMCCFEKEELQSLKRTPQSKKNSTI